MDIKKFISIEKENEFKWFKLKVRKELVEGRHYITDISYRVGDLFN